jgi:dTDP-4-dehydrorhamnose 3,5-epimerase
MTFTETELKGAYIISVEKLEDERGFFGRSFCTNTFELHGLKSNIVQSNISHNKRAATVRGLHMQKAPYEETKLVRCTRGSIFDVIVDLRSESATFKKWIGVELTAHNYKMLYVPEGFAHGYLTLEDDSEITYQVTQFYNAASEVAFRWDDPAFEIAWPVKPVIISERDKNHPLFKDAFPGY